MERNPIRLTSTSYAVMSMLDILGQATPYDLKRLLEQSIENFWPVPHTTFYTEPTRLAGAGLLSEQQESGGRRRKLYALTDAGRAALHDWRDSPDIAPPQLRDEAMLKLFAGAEPRPILRARAQWQRAKVAELEGYLELMQASRVSPRAERWRGAEATLIAGIAYHRHMLAQIEECVAE
jgi:PadR family transcriptional regulator, regulatory protein AphA